MCLSPGPYSQWPAGLQALNGPEDKERWNFVGVGEEYGGDGGQKNK